MLSAGVETRQPAPNLSTTEGESYAVDDCSSTNNSLAAGIGDQLHDGRGNPYPSGDRHYNGPRQADSGATSAIISG
jgi:hypothetical protein